MYSFVFSNLVNVALASAIADFAKKKLFVGADLVNVTELALMWGKKILQVNSSSSALEKIEQL